MNSIITLTAKRKMVRARKGEIALPVIAGIAIGDGAIDADGNLIPPSEGEPFLKNELLRREYSRCEEISDTCLRYRMELAADELAGKKINEAALYDAEGDLLAIRVFSEKPKDADMEMAFEYEDRF
ncbi:MAG: phage tail protein [bacterium]|nr:phage tail protein [bacterium]MCM1376139.1 phage tail protein [Muribaculum sp.]